MTRSSAAPPPSPPSSPSPPAGMAGMAGVAAASPTRRVVWTNGSGVAHTVTPDNAQQAGALTGAQLAAGGTLQHTFVTTGTYAYNCNNHNGMTGTVTVQQGSLTRRRGGRGHTRGDR